MTNRSSSTGVVPSGPRVKRRRRLRRWLLVIGICVVALLGAAFAVLRLELNGPNLASNVASILNKRMRGRIDIGSINWDTDQLKLVVTGGWVKLTVTDVKVWDDCALSGGADSVEARSGDPNEDCTPNDRPDPDPKSHRTPRKLLLSSPKVTGEVDIHALLFGNHDFVFRSLRVHTGEVLLEQTREPYPLLAYDRTIVSLIGAFYPRQRAGFRAGIYADHPPQIFDLRDIHLENINMTWHMSPFGSNNKEHAEYSTTIRLEGVNADAGAGAPKGDNYVYNDGTDPLVTKFYVRLGATAKAGTIRILDQGPTATFRLPKVPGEAFPPPGRESHDDLYLYDIHLNRLAQLPTDWNKHDFVANTLELDIDAKTMPCPTEDEPNPKASDGATVHVSGELDNYWDRPYDGKWDLHLEGKNLGPTIHTCIKRKLGGENLYGTISLTGPFAAMPKVGLDLKNLDFNLPLGKDEEPLKLTLAEVHGSIDLVNDQGYIEKTKALVRGGKEPGEVNVSATFGLRPYNANASIEIVKAIDVGRFLPKKIVDSVGKFLTGRLSARGDVGEGFALEDFDLALGASPTERALRVHKGRLFTNDDFESIHVERVAVEAGKSHAVFEGKIDIKHDDLNIRMDGDFPDLDQWLKRLGLPALAASAGGGTVIFSGKLTAPRITVNTTLTGVPCINQLQLVDLEVQNDVINVRKMTSPGLGGELTGDARVRLGAMPMIEHMHLLGTKLDASKLCGFKGSVTGTIDSIDAELTGSIDPNRSALDWLDHAKVYAKADHLDVKGDRYTNIAACINRPDDARCRVSATYLDGDDLAQCEDAKKLHGSCIVASALRAAGGALDATIAKLPATTGKHPQPARLGGTFALGDLPMAVLDQFVGKSVVGGLANITLHLGGTPTQPVATGAVQLLRAWAAGAFLGDAQIAVEPATVQGQASIAFHGTALAGRLEIKGTLGTTRPYPVELAITGHRIEVDPFVDLTALLKSPDPIQAWVSGTVTVRSELEPVGAPAPEMWVELSEVRAIVDHRTIDGRITPLQLSVVDQDPAVRPAVSIHATTTSVELACRDKATGTPHACTVRVATPAGVIDFAGGLSERAGLAFTATSPVDAKGKSQPLDLSLLSSLFDTRFDHVAGQVRVQGSIHGTFDKPVYEITLELHDVLLRPVGTDTVLQVGAECAVGTPGWLSRRVPTPAVECSVLKLANGSLGFENVKLKVVDEHRDEQGELVIHGGIQFDGLSPSAWGVIIEGKLAGKMLPIVAPNAIAQATGLATIGEDRIRLYGRGARPLIAGSLTFDAAQPLSVLPRGLPHEISFTRGSVDISTIITGDHRTTAFELDEVGGKVDNEGLLERIDGTLELTDSALTKAQLELDADSLAFDKRDVLNLVVSLKGISISLANEQWHVSNGQQGGITVVSGTYKSNFELTDRITKLAARNVPAKPFWETYPQLANADLDLTLHVAKFSVANNVAPSIELTGDAAIRNTPRDPRIQGTISVQQGIFRIPGTRATFITRQGSKIDFKDTERASNPALNVISEANYTDLSGQLHIITMTINGTLEQPQWDLTTSTGYNKSQTLSLLVLGRNQESLRRSFGDQQLGSTPQTGDVSTNPSQGVADQIVKDLAGDWVSGLLGTSLTQLTGLDVLRFEIGFGSVGIHIEKKFLENVQVIVDAEQTIRGNTLNPRGVLKTPLKLIGPGTVKLEVGWLGKNYYDPAELDISDKNLKLTYRLFIP